MNVFCIKSFSKCLFEYLKVMKVRKEISRHLFLVVSEFFKWLMTITLNSLFLRKIWIANLLWNKVFNKFLRAFPVFCGRLYNKLKTTSINNTLCQHTNAITFEILKYCGINTVEDQYSKFLFDIFYCETKKNSFYLIKTCDFSVLTKWNTIKHPSWRI